MKNQPVAAFLNCDGANLKQYIGKDFHITQPLLIKLNHTLFDR